MKILITGATGHLGTAVITTLLKKIPPKQIALLIRKEEKRKEFEAKGFHAFLGNYDDLDSLQKAMRGVDTVLLISSTDEGDRMQQHHKVVDAAKKTGVANIAYTSRSLKDKSTLSNKLMIEHFDTEDYIKQSGLNYTLFRNALYMDVLPLFVGKQVFEKGIFQPAGNGKVAFALRNEMGEAIANVLLNEKWENKVYWFTGSEAYSFYDVASALTQLSEKEVTYTPVGASAFMTMMLEKGLLEPMVQKIIGFNTDISNGQEATVTNDLEMKLGRKPSSLAEGIKLLFSAKLA